MDNKYDVLTEMLSHALGSVGQASQDSDFVISTLTAGLNLIQPKQ